MHELKNNILEFKQYVFILDDLSSVYDLFFYDPND